MNGPTRRGGVGAALIAAILLLAGISWGAEEPSCVGVQLEPARLARDGATQATYDVVVRNCTDASMRITLTVGALGHDLDGAPEFFDSSEAEDALVLAEAGTFALDPGEEKTVEATATIPDGERSLYAGVVAEFERLDGTAGTSVETRSRVAAMLLMRGPKPWRQSARVTDITLSPNEDGSYAVHAAIQDTGNVHINPTGRMQIVKDGTLLDTVQLTGATILPGYKRRLTGQWVPPPKLDGKVRLNAEVRNPDTSGTTEIDFSEGVADVPEARITSLVASDAGGAYLAVALLNTGRIDITPTIELVVTEGPFERGRILFPQTEPMRPGEERVVEWEPDLPDGTYRVVARARQGEGLLDEKVTGLRVGAVAEQLAAAGMPWPWIVIASLLLVAVLIALLLVVARRRRDHDHRPPPPAAPASPLRELARTGAR